MEARIGGENHHFYAAGASSLNVITKKGFEWDLNDWRWDGEHFVASRLSAAPANCRNKQVLHDVANGLRSNSSPSSSEEANFGLVDTENGAEKRRRILVVEEEEYDENGHLSLELGGHAFPVKESKIANGEERNGKKSKPQSANSNQPTCQVEGCGADLRGSKDYHRRHKVCEMHAKASTAVVGNAIQRFCQQCSRFHLLQEFDEGKRSCRRRLAGHNRRRRKTHPEIPVSGSSSSGEQASSYLLISLLRILSNLQADNSERSKDQELLTHFLNNIAKLAGPIDSTNISRLLQTSQDQQKLINTVATSSGAIHASALNVVPLSKPARLTEAHKMACVAGIQGPRGTNDQSATVAVSTIDMNLKRTADSLEPVTERVIMKDFDLNHAYVDMEECAEGLKKTIIPSRNRNDSAQCPSWLLQDSHQYSPPQTSNNADSSSSQSLSSSNGDAQCRTDRIVFKLFGKDPNDFPLALRTQILDWLSHSPTDIESYIRPGCIILTIYLRLSESAWNELCFDLSSQMNRLLHNCANDFWRTGWIYARIHDHIFFAYNGKLVLDIPRITRHSNRHMIYSVSPVAVSHCTTVTFTVKGFNLAQPTSRLLCLFEGSYLVQETTQALVDGDVMGREHSLSQNLSFSCSVPSATGRGFIEVEDYGLSNVSFPFIVAEEDICSEVCMLENAIDVFSCDNRDSQLQEATDGAFARNQALNFIHELGWLLRRNHIMSADKKMNYFLGAYSLMRFRWLMSFAIDQEWAAVVKKLIDILFNGIVDLGKKSPAEVALSEDLLNRAVHRNSKTLVEVLLRYVPEQNIKETGPSKYLFRPDIIGPSNLTPLHIAASSSGTESVVDALTDDPGLLGIKAWRNLRDDANCTPEDYARARGHDSYVSLVQMKIDKHVKSQVVINVPGNALTKIDGSNVMKLASFEMSKNGTRLLHRPDCHRCNQQFAYRTSVARTLLYRPSMLCMVGVAAVCVCVGLLLKTPPQVFYVSPSFRWELLHYGSI